MSDDYENLNANFDNSFRKQALEFIENYAPDSVSAPNWNPKSFKRSRLIDFSEVDMDEVSVERENNRHLYERPTSSKPSENQNEDSFEKKSEKSFKIFLKKSMPVLDPNENKEKDLEKETPDQENKPKRKTIIIKKDEPRKSNVSSDRQSVIDFFQRAKEKINVDLKKRDLLEKRKRNSIQSMKDSAVRNKIISNTN